MQNTEYVRAAIEGNFAPPEPESVEKQLESELLTPQPRFESKWLDLFQPELRVNPHELAAQLAKLPTYDPRIRVHFERVGLDGEIGSVKLVPTAVPTASSLDGMAMTRRMGAKKNTVRGKSGQMPFTPGGFDISGSSSTAHLHRSNLGLLDVAPGLSRTGNLNGAASGNAASLVNEREDSDQSEEDLDVEESDAGTEFSAGIESERGEPDESLGESKYNDIDNLLPATSSFVRDMVQASSRKREPAEKTWAHMVDVNQSVANFSELVPKPARTWPFELDNFQKEAVYHLEQGDSVFIAAHTSAGKTVIAEYAMSMAAQHMTKCIYTSPIKALSNQKYRDFTKEYEDVGILTGDVQLNPDASTLIMTTEILRSMLYRGADIIRDVEFIIFDEVHYVNDSERGVVWEEVIIMLPDHVKLVLLSATVPNTFEFANWVGRTKEKDVYVISTPKRPVPLEHYIWVKNQKIELIGEDRKFNTVNYNKAQQLLIKQNGGDVWSHNTRGATARGGSRGGGRGGSYGGRGGSSGQQALRRQLGPQTGRFNNGSASKNELLTLADHLRERNLLPAVMFVFSRKMCETYASHLQSVVLNSNKEKSQVYMFLDKAVSRLRKEDRDLPQIQTLRVLLQQGIGVHHSGLLPIMKEVVEILFAKGLVKLLFATETFAMGLNLPTRTVVFTSVRKFDSKTMRYLSPGEYTQMAGRAGRRGLDSVGTVIIMNNNKEELIPSNSLNQMMLGTPQKLSSQFRLTYNMILSLLRIEALKVEDVIQRSFSENSQHVLRPERERKLVALEKGIQESKRELEKEAQRLHLNEDVTYVMEVYCREASLLHNSTLEIYKSTDFGVNAKKGRFCFYRSLENSTLMVGVAFSNRNAEGTSDLNKRQVGVVTLGHLHGSGCDLPYFASLAKSVDQPHPRLSAFAEIKRRHISFSQLEILSGVRVPLDLNQDNSKTRDDLLRYYRENTDAIFTEISLRKTKGFGARVGLMDRAAHAETLKLYAEELLGALKTSAESNGTAVNRIMASCENLYPFVSELVVAEGEANVLRTEQVGFSNAALLPDYKQRMNVLRQANYVDEGYNVALKGRVACEISTGYELYVTELIMDNFLGSYEPEEIVALLSAFVFEGVRDAQDPSSVTPRLDEGKERLLELVDYVQNLATENQVAITQDEADFALKNRFALMQVVYEWARGMTFSEITKLTTVQEGLIVRVINRLDEVCRSVMSAARIIGEVDLYDKLAIAQERIKRDIVFCSSLYL